MLIPTAIFLALCIGIRCAEAQGWSIPDRYVALPTSSAIRTGGSEGASFETTYKWRDEKGKLHLSNTPPMPTCLSTDCKKIFRSIKENEDRENQEKAREEAENIKIVHENANRNYEARKRHDKAFENYISGLKSEIRGCSSGYRTCIPRKIQESLRNIGPSGIIEILGRPLQIQYLSDDVFWYYTIAGQRYQLNLDDKETFVINVDVC